MNISYSVSFVVRGQLGGRCPKRRRWKRKRRKRGKEKKRQMRGEMKKRNRKVSIWIVKEKKKENRKKLNRANGEMKWKSEVEEKRKQLIYFARRQRCRSANAFEFCRSACLSVDRNVYRLLPIRADTRLKIMEDLLVVRNFFFWHTKTHIWRENGLDNHIRGAHQAYKKGWW